MGILGKLFGKYLLVTNTVSCGLMMGFGDLFQQGHEHWKQCSRNESVSLQSGKLLKLDSETKIDNEINSITLPNIDDNDKKYVHDYIRTKNMIIVGSIQGPFHHYFYAILERTIPKKDAVSLVKKILADQFIASPACLAIFFCGLGALEHNEIGSIQNEVALKFLDTWKIDWCFWPPVQFINFLLVPIQYRVIYTNLMTMIYDTFLSYMRYDAEYD
ncbi:mpv17-like protein 2 [Neodiprion virginianus]|uniref:mpv17-like protein 2 n=1 Tax=Neodiprion virginianus TaxID=2961670 RepID=UPI001EE69E1A|nr:mpv17-like protein 2 [Neodiprion virginianus]